jgi:hypothetical protein
MDRRLIEKELDSFAQRMQNQGITIRFDAKLAYGDIPGRLMELVRLILEFKKTHQSKVSESEDLDISSIRSLIEAIESKIMILRTMAQEERERFERMELELEQELKLIEENVTKSASKMTTQGPLVTLSNDSLPTEVSEFQVIRID